MIDRLRSLGRSCWGPYRRAILIGAIIAGSVVVWPAVVLQLIERRAADALRLGYDHVVTAVGAVAERQATPARALPELWQLAATEPAVERVCIAPDVGEAACLGRATSEATRSPMRPPACGSVPDGAAVDAPCVASRRLMTAATLEVWIDPRQGLRSMVLPAASWLWLLFGGLAGWSAWWWLDRTPVEVTPVVSVARASASVPDTTEVRRAAMVALVPVVELLTTAVWLFDAEWRLVALNLGARRRCNDARPPPHAAHLADLARGLPWGEHLRRLADVVSRGAVTRHEPLPTDEQLAVARLESDGQLLGYWAQVEGRPVVATSSQTPAVHPLPLDGGETEGG